MARVSGSAGKGFREDRGLPADGLGGEELAYTVTWGAVTAAQTRPPAWEAAEAGSEVVDAVETTGVVCRDTGEVCAQGRGS